MDLQEKLHLSVGRNRKKIAIGIHDFDKVKPPFNYIAVSPEEFSFVPLGLDEKMNLKEIIEKHPKGIEYGYLIKDFEKYPLIIDSSGKVLSFPPIINGKLTQLTENTKNLFIDVTGIDLFTVINTLNLTVTALNEISKNNFSVNVNYPDGNIILPNLGFEKLSLKKSMVESVLGFNINDDDISDALKSMGYKTSIKKDSIDVKIPPFRIDIMHPVDVIEDIAKVYGFNKIERKKPDKFSMGLESDVEITKERIRKIMTGLGYIEVINLIFTSNKRNFEVFHIKEEKSQRIVNPVIEDQYIYRTWLIPMLLETLKNNKHRNLPQKIFELGEIYDKKETIHLGSVEISANASFTEIKGLVGKFFQSLSKQMNFFEGKNPFLIDGRQADLIIGSEKAGFFGELHPEIIEKFELGNPIIVFEIDVEKLFPNIFNNMLKF